ncbi:MAG: M3 family oligoendopeptidase [Deltaproteobacteria bacterium]|jgi:oligoendopeptidase F|nr:M3 family oligoendopeptidase [Deltaproteobacteria bacterium]
MTAETLPPNWDLSQLYVFGSPELERDMKALDEAAAGFPRWRERLADPGLSPEEFAGLLDELARLQESLEKVMGYAELAFSEDTGDQRITSFLGVIEERAAGFANATLFFEIWWKDLPEDRAQGYLRTAAGHRYFLKRLRDYRPFTLSEPEEKVVNLKDVTGVQALVTLYDSLTGRYRFCTGFLPGGSRGEVGREELSVYYRSPDPAVRRGAYRELFRVYSAEGPVLGQIFQSLARSWRLEHVALRGYRSPQSVRNLRNDLSDEAVDSLLRVAGEEAPRVFGRYFARKAALLKLPRLSRYDLYAPVAEEAGGSTAFAEAAAEVDAAFRGFSPRMADLAARVAAERRLSARVLPRKRSGAFCASVLPGETPWVLMSYKGGLQDLFTLAHELGHAVHSQLAGGEGVFQFQAALPLAETASTFAEMLLAQRLLGRETDPLRRSSLLCHVLDDAYATVGRQAFFALFEVEAHAMIERGATPDELSEAYMANLARQFGDTMDIPPEFRWEWAAIPHFFHAPFYVYAYTFGQLLVFSLWRLFEREGAPFEGRLLKILAKGGGASAADILASAGVGPLDDGFWRGGFRVIGEFVDAL